MITETLIELVTRIQGSTCCESDCDRLGTLCEYGCGRSVCTEHELEHQSVCEFNPARGQFAGYPGDPGIVVPR